MKFAVIAEDGHTILQTGFAPEDMIEIQGGDLLSVPAPDDVEDSTHFWNGEGFSLYPERPAGATRFDPELGNWVDDRTSEDVARDLNIVKTQAIDSINALAGVVRRLYVADIPGQEALYLLKEQEARAWVASVSPDLTQYPLIAAEVGITAETADQVAQVYLNLFMIYLQAAAQLETARLGHIVGVETSTSPEQASGYAQSFHALIESIQ